MEGPDSSRILLVLEELTQFTRELALSENTPDADIASLTRACEEKLSELKMIMPLPIPERWKIGAESGSVSLQDRQIAEALRKLDAETQHCIQILTRRRDETERELLALRQQRKAVRAYRGNDMSPSFSTSRIST